MNEGRSTAMCDHHSRLTVETWQRDSLLAFSSSSLQSIDETEVTGKSLRSSEEKVGDLSPCG